MGKVLIIDDEKQILGLLSRIIGLEGYEVLQAATCKAGLRQMEQHSPEVVLCDVFLPDGNGVDLVSDLKKLRPLSEIILLTAHGNIPDGVQAIKNGAFDYITKGDYNNKIIAGKARGLQTYLSAWNAKIIPILLTVISTILGFIPFLIGSNVADFWISLAIGTMSGLIFSVLVLMIYLPLFFMRKEDKAGCRRKNSGMKEVGRKWKSHIELNKIRGFIKH